MIEPVVKRPHFKNPPILEQALTLGFERLRDLQIVDHGLFWSEVRDQFPQAETSPRAQTATELFDGGETQFVMSAVPALQLPRAIFRNDEKGEIIQIQDDTFVFNWIRASEGAEYPRFEHTSTRLWQLFEKFAAFMEGRHGGAVQLRQCEMTTVNIMPVHDFGTSYDDMSQAFVIDPFDWKVPGLVAETYVRRRLHRITDEEGKPIGRLHSVISPVTDPSGKRAFQFELTARSAPTIRSREDAKGFFERAHDMMNGAFLASVTAKMRKIWGEYDGK